MAADLHRRRYSAPSNAWNYSSVICVRLGADFDRLPAVVAWMAGLRPGWCRSRGLHLSGQGSGISGRIAEQSERLHGRIEGSRHAPESYKSSQKLAPHAAAGINLADSSFQVDAPVAAVHDRNRLWMRGLMFSGSAGIKLSSAAGCRSALTHFTARRGCGVSVSIRWRTTACSTSDADRLRSALFARPTGGMHVQELREHCRLMREDRKRRPPHHRESFQAHQ